MKRILPIAFALAFAGTLLSGCERDPANQPAGSGSTAGQSGSTSGSAGSTADQKKRGTQSPSGGMSGSGSTSGDKKY